jgi:Domain of unknown function (DUF1931)
LASRHRRPLDPDALLRPRNQKSVHVVGVTQFERFFRAAAGLDVDKSDLKRYSDFVNHKIYDLLLRGEAAAKANGRDIIQPFDLPITKGLQESMHAFRKLEEAIAVQPILDSIMARPPLDLACAVETEARLLPEVAGGLSLALAQTFKIIDPALKNPQSEHWERSFHIFDLLL